MPEFPKEIEIERVINVITGFGWVKVKEEIQDNNLVLTIKKRFIPPGEVVTDDTAG